MTNEQEDISQYPRFITYARAEKQLLKNGFILNKEFYVNTRAQIHVFINKNTGHKAYVKRMNISNYQIFTYKIETK
jgi:hypothetical protein